MVAYPILDIKACGLGARAYVESLEDALIETLGGLHIKARGRVPDATGVWVQDRKIAAIGVKLSRGVSSHGLALNINTDLSFFSHIIPCGIADKPVTTVQQELALQLQSGSSSSHVASFGDDSHHNSVTVMTSDAGGIVTSSRGTTSANVVFSLSSSGDLLPRDEASCSSHFHEAGPHARIRSSGSSYCSTTSKSGTSSAAVDGSEKHDHLISTIRSNGTTTVASARMLYSHVTDAFISKFCNRLGYPDPAEQTMLTSRDGSKPHIMSTVATTGDDDDEATNAVPYLQHVSTGRHSVRSQGGCSSVCTIEDAEDFMAKEITRLSAPLITYIT
ncbi:hypothetical protein CEUSTIGMA_g3876.t1 [Chlamydomonas eustigma]|uniref:lipoyl(octanoyl) transferase n=1 Tax=Chlamydomonas eustigma TaxID=1157962 RepID=A0A250X027_9CHLO|nr:hypothetical protein CEUSTIGMA_g3876.t1 [Chlamydomonas eustigma]|eukprot:GAX76431.1 hypothetical protein CEUSTIGMA_g3876.t1 [Chlamydomonas eustigma]